MRALKRKNFKMLHHFQLDMKVYCFILLLFTFLFLIGCAEQTIKQIDKSKEQAVAPFPEDNFVGGITKGSVTVNYKWSRMQEGYIEVDACFSYPMPTVARQPFIRLYSEEDKKFYGEDREFASGEDFKKTEKFCRLVNIKEQKKKFTGKEWVVVSSEPVDTLNCKEIKTQNLYPNYDCDFNELNNQKHIYVFKQTNLVN